MTDSNGSGCGREIYTNPQKVLFSPEISTFTSRLVAQQLPVGCATFEGEWGSWWYERILYRGSHPCSSSGSRGKGRPAPVLAERREPGGADHPDSRLHSRSYTDAGAVLRTRAWGRLGVTATLFTVGYPACGAEIPLQCRRVQTRFVFFHEAHPLASVHGGVSSSCSEPCRAGRQTLRPSLF